MFASAWQDGVHHLNPKYLRRDTVFTDRVMRLFTAHLQAAVREAEDRVVNDALDYIVSDPEIWKKKLDRKMLMQGYRQSQQPNQGDK